METSNPAKWIVPNAVDRIAAQEPNRLYAEYPNSTLTYDKGYRGVRYSELANAANCVASFLLSRLGPGRCDVLPYIGPNDVRYPALILGASKAGYTVLTTSPRNSVQAQVKLLARLKCQYILSPSPHPPQIDEMAKSTGLPVVDVPSVADMLDKQYPHVPFKGVDESVLDEPFFVFHTSGSTGFPKPLTFTHRSAMRCMTMNSAESDAGIPTLNSILSGKKVWCSFPPFHGAALLTLLCNTIATGIIPVTPISGTIPSAVGMVEGLKKCPAKVALLAPSIVSELAEAPDLLDFCAKNLEMIWYGGGDLPQAVGDTIASKVRVGNMYGASEIGITAQLWSPEHFDVSDWKYVHYHPSIGYEMRSNDNNDGTYELVIVRNEQKIQSQHAFTLFPDLQEYPSRDLFRPHPTKPDLWKWVARRDDIVVFLNGEKTNPVSMEQHIMEASPKVKGALVAGAQRFQAALMIEPASNEDLSATQRAALLEELWPIIEEANGECPAHARISKSHILFTQPTKPMALTAKGTIQRFATYTLYSEELDALYRDAEASIPIGNDSVRPSIAKLKEDGRLESYIRDQVLSTTSWKELKDDTNFFDLGMDSLQAITLTRKLRQSFALPSISPSTVYTNPSLGALLSAVLQISDNHKGLNQTESQKQADTIRGLLEKYRTEISSIALNSVSNTPKAAKDPLTVILTGSTGTLGAHILHFLGSLPNVAHVYCLNRKSDSQIHQIKRNTVLGLPKELSPGKVTFLTANLAQPEFGLDSATYSTLLQSVTTIIHNAWPVNFNVPMSEFEPQLAGVVNLIKFTSSANFSPHLLFTSSISSVMAFPGSKIPEEVIEDEAVAGPNAYAQSKYISELLLSHASSSLGLRTSFARVGQIAGSTTHAGVWNTAEWFPSIVLSSVCVGKIPDSLGSSLGRVDWVPVDKLAKVVIDMAFAEDSEKDVTDSDSDIGRENGVAVGGRVGVFHALNPRSVSWAFVRKTIIEEIAARTGMQLETVDLKSWIDAVKVHGKETLGEDAKLEDGQLEAYLSRNPALKLVDFYEGILAAGGEGNKEGEGRDWEFAKSLKASKELRDLEAVRDEWVRKWVGEWIETKG